MVRDLIAIYQSVFGYKGIPQLIPVNTLNRVEKEDADDITVNEGAQYSDLKSAMGVPLFMPLKIDGIWLPNEPIITISGQNTIVKTVIAGAKGTVKEWISADDYSIKIQGLIINEQSDDYPEEMVRKIRTICEKRESVEVDNRLLTMFDIHQVVIESYSFPGVAGDQDVQAYEITCLSDWPLDLILKEQKK